MSAIRCFWIEPTGEAQLTLHVYCVGCGGGVERDVGRFPFNRLTGQSQHPNWDGLSWPERCEHCGRVFDFDWEHRPHDDRSTTGRSFYRDAQGREATATEFGPGAMWEAPWYGEAIQGDDGRCIIVRVPGNHDWIIDGHASNCGRPDDKAHHCWCRHGEPPNLTVDKNCNTCQAGAGSFWADMPHGWHGHLTNGWLHLSSEPAPSAAPALANVGRRLPDREWPETLPEDVQERDFWYVHGGPHEDPFRPRRGHWYVCAPGHHIGAIPHHKVEEHEDGLISVLPLQGEANSIAISTTRDGEEVSLWHGFIHHGEWRPL